MADAKISALTEVTSPSSSDVLPIVNSSTTKKVTVANLVTKAAVGLSSVTDNAQLKIASNLSDLADAATARTNLGLGDSATKNTGTTAGTVAAGDHNHSGVYAAASHAHAATDITSGTIATARLGSGTANSGTYLRGDQTWASIAGGGDVSKVGSPADNQIGVWTGDGTIEGDTALTFDTSTDTLAIGASGKLNFGAVTILSDSTGTTTLSNIDALDATTEATIEAAIDTLANLGSIGSFTGVLRADSGTLSVDTDVTDIVSAASDTAAGKVELATSAETTTGTDTGRAVTPDGLAGSTIFGRKSLCAQIFEGATDITTGDGKAYITIPESLNGMNLVRAQATVVTAGTTNATTVMVHNKTDSQDMLSGAISIASGGTVGTVGTINTSYDDVATNDVLRIDVDSVSTTAPKGLMVVLEFQLP